MNRICVFCVVFFLFCSDFVLGQKGDELKLMEQQLGEFANAMQTAETDNERFNANDSFQTLLNNFLNKEGSFDYQFTLLNNISILSSSDKVFRIFTWSIADQSFEITNYGIIQVNDKEEKRSVVYKLTDKSDEIYNADYQNLDAENWYGCVYYDLIETKYQKKTFYTLLGYDNNALYVKKRIIEPLSFRGNRLKPVFGQNLFHKEKDRRRYVFEFNPDCAFSLRYEEQYLTDVAQKYEKMIVFDVLEPIFEEMEGRSEFYITSGYINGFKFDSGKWKLVKNIQPRNKRDTKDDEIKPARKGLYQP